MHDIALVLLRNKYTIYYLICSIKITCEWRIIDC
jgi:hypothetical protein